MAGNNVIPLNAPQHSDGSEAEIDLPSAATIDRLIQWHSVSASADAQLALSCSASGLDEAAEKNRKRSGAHRVTADCLRLLKAMAYAPETEFRGHLEGKVRPKAKVRAPP